MNRPSPYLDALHRTEADIHSQAERESFRAFFIGALAAILEDRREDGLEIWHDALASGTSTLESMRTYRAESQ